MKPHREWRAIEDRLTKEYDSTIIGFRRWENGVISKIAEEIVCDKRTELLPILWDSLEDSGIVWPKWLNPAVSEMRESGEIKGKLYYLLRDLIR